MTSIKIKEEDDKIILVVDLKNISDEALVALRNRVVWECKRRTGMGIKLKEIR